MSIIRTDSSILVELIDLGSSVLIFLSQLTLLRQLTFLLGSLTVILNLVLLDLFLSSAPSICSTMVFPPLWNSDHILVSVSIDFPINPKWDAPLHRIVLLLLLLNFVSGFRLEFMYISLILSITSSLTHLHHCCHSSLKSFFSFVPTEQIF